MKILVIDDSKLHREAAQAQFPDDDLTVVGDYLEGQALLKNEHAFEAVLVDLLMPPPSTEWDEEMPIGIFLVLLAAKNGARYVALFTDKNHHEHPGSACLDAFNACEGSPTPFQLGATKMLLTNNTSHWIGSFREGHLSAAMEHMEAYRAEQSDRERIVKAKRWDEVLRYLMNM